MAKKLVDSIEIRPGKGGHVVRTHFKAQPDHSSKLGLMMAHPVSDEHIFGSDQQQQMLAHVRQQLGLGNGAGSPAEDEAKV